jgi:UDP-N-acetylmuramoyl-L-alanyl-D-glutamate--2,6-diaminopimelate ligase
MLVPQIFPVTCHTDHVGEGSTFVAIQGHNQNGADFIDCAIKKGATTIVQYGSSPTRVIHGITYHYVSNTRKALAELSSKALGNPALQLKIIGITGTAGKTTTTFLLEHLLRSNGYKTALLGGVHHQILGCQAEYDLTTPNSDYLQMFLAQCVKKEVTHVVMEVSSASLTLQRTHGILFDAIGFTNLDAEHLEFHKTMDAYFAAKMAIFKQVKQTGMIVINTDNEWGCKALRNVIESNFIPNTNLISVGIAQKDFAGNEIKRLSFSDISTTSRYCMRCMLHKYDGICEESSEIEVTHLFGRFNAYNVSMATSIVDFMGVSSVQIQKSLANFPGVPGRLQYHALKNGAYVFVDYAHKSFSFQEVLTTLRVFTRDLIVVFGCGGQRDKAKRPVIGAIVSKYADMVIVTDDNPRFEDPDSIIRDIIAGIPANERKKVVIEHDRKKAIEQAVCSSRKGSIVALLGKGHERYNLEKGKKIPFSDFDEVKKW